jgi:DNA-binding CsgD family transcriptional regulator
MLHQALEDCRINPQSHAWPTPVAEGHAMAAAPGVLLFLGSGPQRISLAITPLGDWQLSMVTLGRSRATAARLAHNFARAYGLTPTETRVLAALCAGGSPESIASLHGVEVSTVRTQLARLRNRTRSSSMREVLQQVFSLPPVMARLEGPPQSENEANGGF